MIRLAILLSLISATLFAAIHFQVDAGQGSFLKHGNCQSGTPIKLSKYSFLPYPYKDLNLCYGNGSWESGVAVFGTSAGLPGTMVDLKVTGSSNLESIVNETIDNREILTILTSFSLSDFAMGITQPMISRWNRAGFSSERSSQVEAAIQDIDARGDTTEQVFLREKWQQIETILNIASHLASSGNIVNSYIYANKPTFNRFNRILESSLNPNIVNNTRFDCGMISKSIPGLSKKNSTHTERTKTKCISDSEGGEHCTTTVIGYTPHIVNAEESLPFGLVYCRALHTGNRSILELAVEKGSKINSPGFGVKYPILGNLGGLKPLKPNLNDYITEGPLHFNWNNLWAYSTSRSGDTEDIRASRSVQLLLSNLNESFKIYSNKVKARLDSSINANILKNAAQTIGAFSISYHTDFPTNDIQSTAFVKALVEAHRERKSIEQNSSAATLLRFNAIKNVSRSSITDLFHKVHTVGFDTDSFTPPPQDEHYDVIDTRLRLVPDATRADNVQGYSSPIVGGTKQHLTCEAGEVPTFILIDGNGLEFNNKAEFTDTFKSYTQMLKDSGLYHNGKFISFGCAVKKTIESVSTEDDGTIVPENFNEYVLTKTYHTNLDDKLTMFTPSVPLLGYSSSSIRDYLSKCTASGLRNQEEDEEDAVPLFCKIPFKEILTNQFADGSAYGANGDPISKDTYFGLIRVKLSLSRPEFSEIANTILESLPLKVVDNEPPLGEVEVTKNLGVSSDSEISANLDTMTLWSIRQDGCNLARVIEHGLTDENGTALYVKDAKFNFRWTENLAWESTIPAVFYSIVDDFTPVEPALNGWRSGSEDNISINVPINNFISTRSDGTNDMIDQLVVKTPTGISLFKHNMAVLFPATDEIRDEIEFAQHGIAKYNGQESIYHSSEIVAIEDDREAILQLNSSPFIHTIDMENSEVNERKLGNVLYYTSAASVNCKINGLNIEVVDGTNPIKIGTDPITNLISDFFTSIGLPQDSNATININDLVEHNFSHINLETMEITK